MSSDLSNFVSGFSARMRDMLDRLQTISKEDQDLEPDYDVNATLPQQAVVLSATSDIENILTEAHALRQEISLLRSEVAGLNALNERFGTTVRRLTVVKRDFDSLARRIQQRGENLYSRLQDLGWESSQLQEKEGPSSAISRIAKAQYETLAHDLNAVMSDYNSAENMQKTTCRGRIMRQVSILGTEISDEQLDVIVHKGGEGWTELSHSLETEGGRTSRWAMKEIKGRHKELVELEARLREVHQLFLEMAVLVETQGSLLNNIEANVCQTEEYTEQINIHIKRAIQYKKKNPFLQCCPCLSCWRDNKIF